MDKTPVRKTGDLSSNPGLDSDFSLDNYHLHDGQCQIIYFNLCLNRI